MFNNAYLCILKHIKWHIWRVFQALNLIEGELNGKTNKTIEFQPEEDKYKADITYGIDDVPSWYLCIFMALQVSWQLMIDISYLAKWDMAVQFKNNIYHCTRIHCYHLVWGTSREFVIFWNCSFFSVWQIIYHYIQIQKYVVKLSIKIIVCFSCCGLKQLWTWVSLGRWIVTVSSSSSSIMIIPWSMLSIPID